MNEKIKLELFVCAVWVVLEESMMQRDTLQPWSELRPLNHHVSACFILFLPLLSCCLVYKWETNSHRSLHQFLCHTNISTSVISRLAKKRKDSSLEFFSVLSFHLTLYCQNTIPHSFIICECSRQHWTELDECFVRIFSKKHSGQWEVFDMSKTMRSRSRLQIR